MLSYYPFLKILYHPIRRTFWLLRGGGGECARAQSSGVSSYNAWVRRGTSGVILAEFR